MKLHTSMIFTVLLSLAMISCTSEAEPAEKTDNTVIDTDTAYTATVTFTSEDGLELQ